MKIEKSHIFSNYRPLQIWNCNQYISKSIIARSFKLDQLIEDDEYVACLVSVFTVNLLCV